MNIKGIAHIAIQARNYESTLNFYTQALEFKQGHSWSLPEFQLEQACMLISPDGRTCIELFDPGAVIPAQGKPAASPDEVAHGALLHFALVVSNVEEAYHHALSYGATPCVEPALMTLGVPPVHVWNALVYSPNGEVIEFIEDVSFDVSVEA